LSRVGIAIITAKPQKPSLSKPTCLPHIKTVRPTSCDGFHDYRRRIPIFSLYKLTVNLRCIRIQCESKKIPPLRFSDIFPKRLGILHTYLFYVHIYARLQIFVKLSPILTKLCHTLPHNCYRLVSASCKPLLSGVITVSYYH